MSDDSDRLSRFFFVRYGCGWKPCVDIGWVATSYPLHRPPSGSQAGHAFDGVENASSLEPGLYMVIEVNERDTHGGPAAAAAYFQVEKVPERRAVCERSAAQALYGASG